MSEEQPRGHRLEAAAESTLAKIMARVVTPLLIAVVGYFLVGTMTDIKESQQTQGKDISQIKTDLVVVNTRMDERVIRQIDSNTRQLDSHEQRIRELERSVRTP